MIEVQGLLESYQTTNWLIGRFCEGLSHEDSIA